MPTTLPQNNLNTTSDGTGRNIRPELMPESFFFLEKDKAFTQTASNKFGVIGSGINSTFRTTSKISYTGKVFTICQGQIFIQPNFGDINKVNIVLKPFSQPIKGLAIKYIVYRGLAKSDFFTDDGKVLPSGSNATGFINYVQEEFQNFYGNNGTNTTPPEFLAEFLGYPNASAPTDQQQKETDLIDDYFFKVSQNTLQNNQVSEPAKWAYEMPLVPRGTHLGNALGELGIDVVLNEGDYTIENDPNPFQLNLKFARSVDYILNPADGSTDFEKKLIKETTTGFIDIAAFYGLHTQGSGKVFVNTQTNPLENNDDIYSLIKNFSTCNTSYLYIQSNRQRSYNFYGNYDLNGKNIKIGTDINNLQEKKFGTEDWSVEEFQNSSNSETLLVSLLSNKNYFDKIFYVNIGNPQERNKDVLFVKEFENMSDNEKDYLRSVNFKISKSAGIIKLLFVGDNVKETYLTNEPYFLDKHHNAVRDIFPIINAESHLKENGNFYKISFNEKYFVNFKLFSNLQSVSTINNCVVFYQGKKKIGEDILVKEKVLFVAKKEDTIDSNEINNVNLIFGTNSSIFTSLPKDVETNILMQNLYGDANYNFYYNEINNSGKLVKLVKLKYDGQYDSTYFSIGITKEELDQLLATIPENASNVKMYLDEEEYNPILDVEARKSYFKYSLGINYENSNEGLAILFPNEKIYVYGESIHFFASSEFADYETSLIYEPIIIK